MRYFLSQSAKYCAFGRRQESCNNGRSEDIYPVSIHSLVKNSRKKGICFIDLSIENSLDIRYISYSPDGGNPSGTTRSVT